MSSAPSTKGLRATVYQTRKRRDANPHVIKARELVRDLRSVYKSARGPATT